MKKYSNAIIKIIISIIIIAISFQCSNLSYVRAATTINPDEWQPQFYETTSDFSNKVGVILSVINAVGVVVSVVGLMIIGIRTMFGTVEERSTYKESLPGFILGAVLVMAITTIPNIIYRVAFWD